MNNNEPPPPPPPAEPPARIAARFYRNSSQRRKSSAHSSRRSSISSRHSRTSSLSCHGGPYSTHIAQHLRRASIIETRKARLAERAAHAEQVRLRAAAAKAVPRTSNSEEKALAAQAAREKFLADIAARCEEDVKRAKRIAEETKEKKAAEHARLVDEMNEKFANAARRRSIYQMNVRRPRTTSLAAVEEKKIDRTALKQLGQSAAAKIIQRAWRQARTKQVSRSFLSAGTSVNQLRETDFEDVAKKISTEEVMTLTLQMLQHFGMLDGENEEIARRGAARVFLSSFVIVAHPVATFSHGGKQQQEQELLSKAHSLVNAIQVTIDAALATKQSIYNKETLQFLFHDFTSSFHAWKSQDLGILADVIVSSFVSLDSIIQSTKDDRDGNVAEDYLSAVRTEQTKLLVRLKRLLGHEAALTRVRSAVRRARREKAAVQVNHSDQHIPRATTPVDIDMDVSGSAVLTPSHSSAPEAAPKRLVEPLPTPPATPSSRTERNVRDVPSLMYQLERSMTALPPNREISHEIQMEGTFEIEQQPWTEARRTFRDLLRQNMRRAIEEGGKFEEAEWTSAMTSLIRAKLFSLVSDRHPLYTRIKDFLDADLLAQQCYNNVLNYSDFFRTIAQIIGQLCSPGRDKAVKEFAEDVGSDSIDRLFCLMDIIDLMLLDHVNFQFRMSSRMVVEHGHEHEHVMFDNDLKAGLYDLTRTKAWWSHGRANVSNVNPNTAAYANAVYARALTETVLGNKTLLYEDVPETLRLDYLRLHKLRAKVFQAVAVASTLLTSKIRLRRNREALWTKEAGRLMRLDFTTTDVARIVSLISSSHMMPDSIRSGLTDFVSRVLPPAVTAVEKAQKIEHDRAEAIQSKQRYDAEEGRAEADTGDVYTEQIATFILKSLREHVYARLAASSAAEKARVTSSASETLARIGMPEFVTEVSGIVSVLEKIKLVDLKAHEKWYDEIAREASLESVS